MKKKTVTNLMLGTITLLGIGYVIKKQNAKRMNKIVDDYMYNHAKELNNSDMFSERKYYTIGNTVLEDGEFVTKRK